MRFFSYASNKTFKKDWIAATFACCVDVALETSWCSGSKGGVRGPPVKPPGSNFSGVAATHSLYSCNTTRQHCSEHRAMEVSKHRHFVAQNTKQSRDHSKWSYKLSAIEESNRHTVVHSEWAGRHRSHGGSRTGETHRSGLGLELHHNWQPTDKGEEGGRDRKQTSNIQMSVLTNTGKKRKEKALVISWCNVYCTQSWPQLSESF